MSMLTRIGSWFAGLTWRGVAMIVLMCALNAIRRTIQNSLGTMTFLEWLEDTTELFLTGSIVAAVMTLTILATYNRAPDRPQVRYPALVAAIVVSSMVGVLLALAIESEWTFEFFKRDSAVTIFGSMLATWPRHALLGGLFTGVFVYFQAAEASDARARVAELDRVRFDQQMDEARLQVLQAQIEPHFLFNTLAHVRRLYQTDPTTGRTMLDNLLRYLTEALPQMREPQSTVAREAALAEAYLGIEKIRMGRRLDFAINVQPAIADAQLPPMMLLTLVENAIKHGLSPQPEGGTVTIRAQRERGHVIVDVTDTGRGFGADSGTGTGLANTRARLAGLYGTAAKLSLALNPSGGVRATLRIPDRSPTRVPA
jgi:signal transduction histidine kinase